MRAIFLIVTTLMVSSCQTTHDVKKPDVPIIPRAEIFGNPDRANPKLSPDGRKIAYLQDSNGVLNIWVAPVSNPEKATVVTADKKRGIRSYLWTHLPNKIIYVQDEGGNEDFHIYLTDIVTKKTKNLTPFKGARAQISKVSKEKPNEILVAINDRNQSFFDKYRINLSTGKRELVYINDSFGDFIADDEYNLVLASKPNPDGGKTYFKKQGKKWTKLFDVSRDDAFTTYAIAADTKDGFYLVDSRDRNTASLKYWNLKTNKQTVIASNDKADIGSVLRHPETGKVIAVSSNYKRQEWKVIDKSYQVHFEKLSQLVDGEIAIVSSTADLDQLLVAAVRDDGPVEYYSYNLPKKEAKFLFVNRKALKGKKLAKMKPVIVKTRDSLNLLNYLSLPPWQDPDMDGVPSKPLPMVLMVHGGPWARTTWGYNSLHQWLTNRGYAVLDVNFRGSTGFGKNFLNAGDNQWSAKMHDDLIDSVEWAIDQKITTKDQVAIMGGSYGGYVTLVGLTFTPDTFACGVDIVGPSNLITLMESVPAYWKPFIEQLAKRVGDFRTEEGRAFLKKISPLTYADRIKKPLLIGQGANDPRVKQAESDQIVSKMKEKNIPVTYVLYPDEGHGFQKPENNLSFFAVTEQFLASCLKGRSQGFGNGLKGASIQVPEGAEHIPGLKAALNNK